MGPIDDIELDRTKLSPDEADERWRRAGETIRTRNPDAHRSQLAVVEACAASLKHEAGASEASDARGEIADVVMRAVVDAVANPWDSVRFRGIEMLLRAIDWTVVPRELVIAVFRLLVGAAPLDALTHVHPLAADPAPMVPPGHLAIPSGVGIALYAQMLLEVSRREATGALGSRPDDGEAS